MTGRVLVTGGNGRLGRAVLAALGDRGVAGVRGKGINGAIAIDSAGTVDAARLAGIDAVINCAGRVSGAHAEIEQANRLYAVAVARRAREAGVGRFVQVSSFSIYGDAERIDGETSLAPQTDYARSKLAAEHELADLATRDFRVVSLRLPFMFSASEPALLGKLVTAMLKLRMVPVPRGSASRRSMITYGGAAEALATLATAPVAAEGVLVAADPQPLDIALLARTVRARLDTRIAIVPVPAFAARLARALAPDMVDRLMRSSVLAPSANVLAAGTSAPVAAEIETYLAGMQR